MKNFLFICSQNKLRSPTAEQVFSYYPEVDVRSAGLNNDAETPICSEDILWADYIFVMERTHRSKLQGKYRKFIKNQRIIVLDIPDDYEYMDPVLVEILKKKVEKFI